MKDKGSTLHEILGVRTVGLRWRCLDKEQSSNNTRSLLTPALLVCVAFIYYGGPSTLLAAHSRLFHNKYHPPFPAANLTSQQAFLTNQDILYQTDICLVNV